MPGRRSAIQLAVIHVVRSFVQGGENVPLNTFYYTMKTPFTEQRVALARAGRPAGRADGGIGSLSAPRGFV